MNRNNDYALQTDWSNEETKLLCELWKEGMTGAKTAAQLNKTFHGGVYKRTRNAIIGKIHRLQKKGLRELEKRPNPIPEVKERLVVQEPISHLVPPLYKPERYCAEPECFGDSVESKSYCEYHCSLYYVKPDKLKEKWYAGR